MKFWRWVKEHWYLPLFAVGAVIGALVGAMLQAKGRVGPTALVKEELAAVKESSRIAEVLATEGHKAAIDAVEGKHYELVKILDENAAKKADRLKSDPVALSRHLERVGQRLRR